MQKTILKTLLSLGLLAFAFSANAKWYTSNGIGTTRDEAVNDALENIMMQSGADVKLLQVYKNGALQTEDFPEYPIRFAKSSCERPNSILRCFILSPTVIIYTSYIIFSSVYNI